jgi:hypothetical protein
MAGIACSLDYLHSSGAGEVVVTARRLVFNLVVQFRSWPVSILPLDFLKVEINHIA